MKQYCHQQNCNSAFSIQISKTMKPKIDPCGTPDNKTWKKLYALFIFTFCFQPFKYEQIYLK